MHIGTNYRAIYGLILIISGMLVCLYTLYILFMFEVTISNSFQVINLVVFPP